MVRVEKLAQERGGWGWWGRRANGSTNQSEKVA